MSNPVFSVELYRMFYLIFMLVSAVFIFIFNSTNTNPKHLRRRMVLSVVLFAISAALGLIGLCSMEYAAHGYFSLFLISESVHLLFAKNPDRQITIENRVLSFLFFLMIGINTVDTIFENISLLYGAWILPFLLPFFFIFKYSQLNRELHAEIISLDEMTSKEKESYESSIYLVVNMLESKNEFLKGHSEKVSLYATLIGNRIGLNAESLEELQTAALLHDIGYVGIAIEEYSSRKIINSEDFMRIKKHPKIGADILRKSSQFSRFADYVLYHHENWDGTGYPNGIIGEKIPLFARIIQIADTYDALTTDRFYRAALSREDAMIILRTGKGTDYDPDLVDVFLKCVEVKT
ncbi:MAG: HD-GYP domain-containing protein [Brevinematales bacterium]|nr:HD-GYP domain-containing protein [Brevinematales bacterium]